jgi:hypothetical protein
MYATLQVENIAGNKQVGEAGRMRERGMRVRDSVWLRTGCGIGHKFDCWSNSSELRDT